jgi:hypothetical protein
MHGSKLLALLLRRRRPPLPLPLWRRLYGALERFDSRCKMRRMLHGQV